MLAVNAARRWLPICGCIASLVVASCANEGAVQGRGPANPEVREQARSVRARMAESRLTLPALQQLNFAFADRYATVIVAACDDIINHSDNPERRRAAAGVRARYVNAIYDIVTGPDPLTQLVDLALVVTLQSQIYIDDNLAAEEFGDQADGLILAIRRAREEVWELLARVFTTEQLDSFDRLIWLWRRDHPGIRFVGFIRFDEFASFRARDILDTVKRGGGFLAPVSDATRAVDEARLFGERAFYLAKRLPILVELQVDVAQESLLSNPALQDVLQSHGRLPDSLHGVMESLEDVRIQLADLSLLVPREREAIFGEIDERVARIHTLLDDADGPLANADALVTELRPLVESGERTVLELRAAADAFNSAATTADNLVARVTVPPDDPRFKPFDIADYTAAAAQLADAARELRNLLDQADTVVASDNLTRRLDDADQRLGAHIDRIFWRAAILIALFFVLLAVYRLVFRIRARTT